jgi:hypothetical protein
LAGVRRAMAAADGNMVANLSWADILGVLDELPMLNKICEIAGRACIAYALCPSKMDAGLACEC